MECSNCEHFERKSARSSGQAWCRLHRIRLPDMSSTGEYRVCLHLKHAGENEPDRLKEKLFARLGRPIEPKVLYGYAHPTSSNIRELCRF